MSTTVLLYWFPLFLGAALGARLATRRHGAVLGVLCAGLWVATVQTNVGAEAWHDVGLLFSTLCGAAAIALVGYSAAGWMPESSRAHPGTAETRQAEGNDVEEAGEVDASEWDTVTSEWGFALQSMTSVFQQFDAWLEVHRYNDDPWADFDEFLRSVLFQWVGGTHVRTYRVLSEGDELIPLREIEAGAGTPGSDMVSARRGIAGYVATTGRSFLAGDLTHGTLVDQLMSRADVGEGDADVAEDTSVECAGEGSERTPRINPRSSSPAWCFPIIRGRCKIGVVTVGHFETSVVEGRISAGAPGPAHGVPWTAMQLRLVELVIAQFWNALTEVCRGQAALTTDPGSAGLTRKAFFEIGREVLTDAYRLGEPVVVAVIGMEGLRALDDKGQWDAADDIRATVSSVLRQRLRTEDQLGRFDDSRFVLFLRRVDSELAMLIAKELVGQLSTVLASRESRGRRVELRCGLAGSGVTGDTFAGAERKPSLEKLVSAAIESCQQAREASVMISSDLDPAEAPELGGSPGW